MTDGANRKGREGGMAVVRGKVMQWGMTGAVRCVGGVAAAWWLAHHDQCAENVSGSADNGVRQLKRVEQKRRSSWTI